MSKKVITMEKAYEIIQTKYWLHVGTPEGGRLLKLYNKVIEILDYEAELEILDNNWN